ncbi:MAG: hypothetical protein EKK53_29050 [Burkholderiales bacterium]|nr:MAG: hypothetical protein EKK53_29050 [Burkholderiales bacterium]
MTPIRRLLAALLGATALASCAQTPPEPASQRLARDLRTAIGPARCTADSQCRTLPIGAKACGGPAGYWAWSTLNTDAQAVQDLAARQGKAAREEVAASGMQSNCAIVTDPGARCDAGVCKLDVGRDGAR